MPRCSIAVLIGQILATTILAPVAFWFGQRSCSGAAHPSDSASPRALAPDLSKSRFSAVVGAQEGAPWAAPLIQAIENVVNEAYGSAAAADAKLAETGLPEDLVADVLDLIKERMKERDDEKEEKDDEDEKDEKDDKDGKDDKDAAKDQAAGRQSPAARGPPYKDCPAGRGPVAMPIKDQLTMPVLDGMNGRVSPSGPEAPNMPANAWGVPMPNLTVEVSPGKILTVDELVYGYDLVFEGMHLFSYVSWGRVPMQQDPADALAFADLISRLQPDCFVELGTNTGGGAVFYAEAMKQYVAKPLVVTIDVHEPIVNWDKFGSKVCPHCVPVTCHPTWHEEGLIKFIKGFTEDEKVIAQVDSALNERKCKRTIVMHDSDHRGFAVERDLQIYHRFVQPGSYLIVQDTKLSRMRGGRYKTFEAVQNFLATPAGKGRFAVDKSFEYLLFSHHHGGVMQRLPEP